MFLLKKFLSAWLLPPLGLPVIALLALIFLRGRWGKFIASASMLMALLLSLPIAADVLSGTLDDSPISVDALNEAQAIVILGGGVHYGAAEYGGDTLSKYSFERVRYGAKLARASKLPILVTGGSVFTGKAEGQLMQKVLQDEYQLSVRWVEIASRDTQENAVYSAIPLHAAGIKRIVLVTSSAHMRRSKAAFQQQGLTVIPAPTGFTPHGTSLFESILPSMAHSNEVRMQFTNMLVVGYWDDKKYPTKQKPPLS